MKSQRSHMNQALKFLCKPWQMDSTALLEGFQLSSMASGAWIQLPELPCPEEHMTTSWVVTTSRGNGPFAGGNWKSPALSPPGTLWKVSEKPQPSDVIRILGECSQGD